MASELIGTKLSLLAEKPGNKRSCKRYIVHIPISDPIATLISVRFSYLFPLAHKCLDKLSIEFRLVPPTPASIPRSQKNYCNPRQNKV